MFAERVFRIDFFEFAPDATGLIDLTEMTERVTLKGSDRRYGTAAA